MSGPVATVTGARRGIGRATAIRLAKDFSGIVVVARTIDTLRNTASGRVRGMPPSGRTPCSNQRLFSLPPHTRG